jgi:hypothetical protein
MLRQFNKGINAYRVFILPGEAADACVRVKSDECND